MGFFRRSSNSSGSSDSTAVYQAEVDVTTASGESVTYRGSGLGPAKASGAHLLDTVEAAARDAEPGGTVTGSRVRRAR
ncbi:hypothetical protein F7Q99_38310 [Streptomyces kaniharaensis]|uniref:Uncharacterized protein n=1 Tax=Streptomyces kaniharaensis TaxID=212423 RepID=A0A6N7L4R0_9ACTN|nr:hypothetical protein [Streptomyces kaniharaensis]MQS17889.1 hypothetical protein [Streptomyces kaniharaensis]